MLTVQTPDGVELHWERRGQGPLVVLAIGPMSYPAVYDGLAEELGRDHAFVTYDARGFGSSRPAQGPFDLATDASDLGHVIEAALGEPEIAGPGGVVVGVAYGENVALALSEQQPELVRALVCGGGMPVDRERFAGTESFSASQSVVDMLVQQAQTDQRGVLRSMIASTNVQADEDEIRERVDRTIEYTDRDASLERVDAWLADREVESRARALGERLLILDHGTNPWLPQEARDLAREVLPEASIEVVEDGPLSRPDLTAAAVRRASGVRA